MTSVPKPLKFLRDKFDLLKEAYDKMVSVRRTQRCMFSHA
jgi:hypothetical protein